MPLYIRGRRSFVIGKNLTLGHSCRFDLEGDKKTLFVGSDCEFGDNTHIVAHQKVEIGDNVLVASKVFITDTDHGCYKNDGQDSPKTHPKERKLVSKSVAIGNNVWIGENVVILPGSTIGNGCIIGANSVVSGSFHDGCMIVGAPAKVIKEWDDEEGVWKRNEQR